MQHHFTATSFISSIYLIMGVLGCGVALLLFIFMFRALANKDTLRFLFGPDDKETHKGPPPEDYS